MKSSINSRSGVALVIVLGFLVIISALAVAFFSSVTTELKASRNFATGVSTRQLADSAVNIVMGQVREATTRGAWASQPGMIRTYEDTSNSADAFFKLYSSDNMVVTKTQLSSFVGDQDFSKTWDQSPAFWTDLNSPVLVSDPNNPNQIVPRFPIIDPRAMDVVEGFRYEKVVNKTEMGSGNDRRLPMPTRWIYVLKDGALTTPKDATGVTATWPKTGYKSPSKTNPIVGRIAFWTDDETCKVNLNTAGGHIDAEGTLPDGYEGNLSFYAGSFWDTPRFYTEFDRGMPYQESIGDAKAGLPLPGKGGLAMCQLLQNEFQRYPGHPATTSLGLLFTDNSVNPPKALFASEKLYDLLPRFGTTNALGVDPGTSRGGTQRVKTGLNIPNPRPDQFQVQPKVERLYSSVDELVFAAQNKDVTGGNPASPKFQRVTADQSLSLGTAITPEFVDKFRFFMTAQSRAPELNLWGQPRVTVWPVRHETSSEATGLNEFDNIILFCSTVGGNQTDRPDTTTTASDGPYRYIFTRREVVGGSQTESGKTADNKDVWKLKTSSSFVQDIERPRNRELINYLKGFTNRLIPGVGKKFAGQKYDAKDRDFLLAEIFDYIRCANLRDTKTTIANTAAIKFAERGIVMPSQPSYLATAGSKPSGFGRFPTITEASLVFYYSGPKKKLGDPTGNLAETQDDPALPNYKRATGTMRAFLLFSTFNPMQGYAPSADPAEKDPKLVIEANWDKKFQVDTGLGYKDLEFPKPGDWASTVVYRAPGSAWGGRNFGGAEGFMHTLIGHSNAENAWAPHKTMDRVGTSPPFALPKAAGPLPAYWYAANGIGIRKVGSEAKSGNAFRGVPSTSGDKQEYYPFQTALPAIEIPATSALPVFRFKGGVINVRLIYGGVQMQTLALDFGKTEGGQDHVVWPVPTGSPDKVPSEDGTVTADPATWWKDSTDPMLESYYFDAGTFLPLFDTGKSNPSVTRPSPYNFQTSLQASWSFATRLAWSQQNSSAPQYNGSTVVNYYNNRWKCILQRGDTVKSLIYWNGKTKDGNDMISTRDSTSSGDLRLALLDDEITSEDFQPHPDFFTPLKHSCLLRASDGNRYFDDTTDQGRSTWGNHVTGLGNNVMPRDRGIINLPWGTQAGVAGVVRKDKQPGDFDTGLGNFADGAYCNKQDEGNVIVAYFDTLQNKWIYPVPYFGTQAYEQPGNTYTSPFRQMPSALMMGSLLSRAHSERGWETLVFSPRPAGDNHPGNVVEPKDHLLLDLFHMPIVEPYPISEPFSTAGKVNLNYKIAPFDYIHRSTALRATLHPIRVTGVEKGDYAIYKTGTGTAGSGTYDGEKSQTPPLTKNYRKLLDRDRTIGDASKNEPSFETFFEKGKTDPNGGFFKTASQICEMDLYPQDLTGSLDDWWRDRSLTGDNVREKPYADLYPRITTKSNTYNVHFRVQTLRQLPRTGAGSDYSTWTEGKDSVLGEYRGATTIERYIDPADPRFLKNTPGAVNPDTDSVESLYRFRTVVNKKFNPQ